MIRCNKCREIIQPGDDYFLDLGTAICSECIDSYIMERYDWYDIADELGFSREVVPDEKPDEQEQPIRGQMDMFGGVYGENA